eukprot:COSAG02_NODE_20921_length_809_cov_18.776056_2_plen_50_part_01
MIETRKSYKGFLGSYTLHNINKLPGLKGFDLIAQFGTVLREFMKEHGSIK